MWESVGRGLGKCFGVWGEVRGDVEIGVEGVEKCVGDVGRGVGVGKCWEREGVNVLRCGVCGEVLGEVWESVLGYEGGEERYGE